jgi:nitroreductase
METLDAICGRRSIRSFKPELVKRELIERVLEAAVKAPSAVNAQPWRFVVIEGGKKADFIAAFRRSLNRKIKKPGASVWRTVDCMEKAPVLILVFNAKSRANGTIRLFSSVLDVLHVQSIGAAIENMILAAYDLGLGTLWIGNVFYATRQICKLACKKEQLIAAVSLGYPDEEPSARPRMPLNETVEWIQ